MARDRWSPTAWAVLPALAAVGLAFAVTNSTRLQMLPVVIVVVLIVAVAPAALSVVALLLCQEFAGADGGASLSATFGNQLYYGLDGADAARDGSASTVTPLVGLLAVAAAVCVVRSHRERPAGTRLLDPLGIAVLACILALVLGATLAGLNASATVLGAVNQEARPFLLMGFGFAVGIGVHRRGGTDRVPSSAGAALVLLAALAAFGLATGTTSLDLTSEYPPFYDAALPAVAGAVLIALLFHQDRSARWKHLLIGAAALAIVVLSLRRNVWVAAAVALVLALVIARGRGRAARRIGFGALAVVPVVLAIPGIGAAIGTRIYDTLSSLSSNADESARGHVEDIEIGWEYATRNPITGLGSRHPQLPGLAAEQSGAIYIHNEWLLDWLRFGLLGVGLVVALMLLLVVGAVTVLRARGRSTVLETAAAVFVLMVPISCITAPFLSTTSRWPALVGIAAGILASAHAALRAPRDDAVSATSARTPASVS